MVWLLVALYLKELHAFFFTQPLLSIRLWLLTLDNYDVDVGDISVICILSIRESSIKLITKFGCARMFEWNPICGVVDKDKLPIFCLWASGRHISALTPLVCRCQQEWLWERWGGCCWCWMLTLPFCKLNSWFVACLIFKNCLTNNIANIMKCSGTTINNQ